MSKDRLGLADLVQGLLRDLGFAGDGELIESARSEREQQCLDCWASEFRISSPWST